MIPNIVIYGVKQVSIGSPGVSSVEIDHDLSLVEKK